MRYLRTSAVLLGAFAAATAFAAPPARAQLDVANSRTWMTLGSPRADNSVPLRLWMTAHSPSGGLPARMSSLSVSGPQGLGINLFGTECPLGSTVAEVSTCPATSVLGSGIVYAHVESYGMVEIPVTFYRITAQVPGDPIGIAMLVRSDGVGINATFLGRVIPTGTTVSFIFPDTRLPAGFGTHPATIVTAELLIDAKGTVIVQKRFVVKKKICDDVPAPAPEPTPVTPTTAHRTVGQAASGSALFQDRASATKKKPKAKKKCRIEKSVTVKDVERSVSLLKTPKECAGLWPFRMTRTFETGEILTSDFMIPCLQADSETPSDRNHEPGGQPTEPGGQPTTSRIRGKTRAVAGR